MKDRVNDLLRAGAVLMAWGAALTFLGNSASLAAPKNPVPVVAPKPTYARLADLVIAAPAIAVVTVKKMTALPAERAQGVAQGNQRFIVTADTRALIRGNDVLAKQASFLIDLPGTPKSKPPKWKGRSFILFGTVEERVDFFQLLSSRAILSWSPDNEAFVRKVAVEMAAKDAPPVIRSVDSVFFVGGAVAGEGESQIFLVTADGSPISLSIIRKPDESPQFGVSLGEIVDEAAAMPPADTPLWYRLACALPPELPRQAVTGQSASDAAAAARDYQAFMTALAPCDRAPTPLD